MKCAECTTVVAVVRTIDGISVIEPTTLRGETKDPFEYRCVRHVKQPKKKHRKLLYVETIEMERHVLFRLVDKDHQPTSHSAQAPKDNHFRITDAVERIKAVASISGYRIEGDEVWNRYA